MKFFQGFTLDTLLGALSCILGIVALLLGSKVYKEYKKIKSSLNDHKEFKDNSADYSQRAAGDIINTCDMNALTKMTTATFDVCLKQAYSRFDEQTKCNLQQIIEQTKQIINEHKPNIAGLTKIDWINIYFESAKNTSDEYMQNIWAKVLAKELENPGSFSYKTLDVLKNMSSEDFMQFERLSSLELDGYILQEDIHTKYGITYYELLKLSERGLINMNNSRRRHVIQAHSPNTLVYDNYVVIMNNPDNEKKEIGYGVYVFTSVAQELQKVVRKNANEEYIKECAQYILKQNKEIDVSLHKIISIGEEGIRYELDDLLERE